MGKTKLPGTGPSTKGDGASFRGDGKSSPPRPGKTARPAGGRGPRVPGTPRLKGGTKNVKVTR